MTDMPVAAPMAPVGSALVWAGCARGAVVRGSPIIVEQLRWRGLSLKARTGETESGPPITRIDGSDGLEAACVHPRVPAGHARRDPPAYHHPRPAPHHDRRRAGRPVRGGPTV